jgi:hypothetical protein
MFMTPLGSIPIDFDLAKGTAKLLSFGHSNHHRAYHGGLTATQVSNNEPNWKEDAHLAHAAYSKAPVEGYTIDSDLSIDKATVYKNNQTGKATIAFAGTEPNRPGVGFLEKAKVLAKDFWADRHILMGTEQQSQEFHDAYDLTGKVIAKYGKQNVHTTGHSLGGTKSEHVSEKFDVPSTTFNKGVSPIGIIRHAGQNFKTPKSKDYITPGDLISNSTALNPNSKLNIVRADDKLKKVTNLFKNKGYEAAAGVSLGEAAAAIHPVVGAAYAGYGGYKLASALNGLHDSSNFITPRSVKTQEDRVSAEQDRVNTPKSSVWRDPSYQAPVRTIMPKETKPVVGIFGGSSAIKNSPTIINNGPHKSPQVNASDAYDRSYGPAFSGRQSAYHSHGFSREHHSRPQRRTRRHQSHRHAH